MREEKKIRKLIESGNAESRQQILDEIKKSYPEYFAEQKPERKISPKKKIMAICFSAGAIALCLAITLPLVLSKSKKTKDNTILYATVEDYEVKEYDKTIKEYAQEYNKNITYLDWYEQADFCYTECYREIKTQEILSLREKIIDGETGESVILQFTEINMHIDVLDDWAKTCEKEHHVESVEIKWMNYDRTLRGLFEFEGYRYYLTLERNTDENRLFELVEYLISDTSKV